MAAPNTRPPSSAVRRATMTSRASSLTSAFACRFSTWPSLAATVRLHPLRADTKLLRRVAVRQRVVHRAATSSSSASDLEPHARRAGTLDPPAIGRLADQEQPAPAVSAAVCRLRGRFGVEPGAVVGDRYIQRALGPPEPDADGSLSPDVGVPHAVG